MVISAYQLSAATSLFIKVLRLQWQNLNQHPCQCHSCICFLLNCCLQKKHIFTNPTKWWAFSSFDLPKQQNSCKFLSLNKLHLVYNALRAKQLFSVSLKHKFKTIIPFSIQCNVFVLQWIISISTVAAATQTIISVHS